MIKFFKNNKHGIIGTAIYIVVLAYFLIFYGFTTKLPLPPEEEYIELMDYGIDNTGLGEIEPAQSSNQQNTEFNNNTVNNSNTNNTSINTQNFNNDEVSTNPSNQTTNNNNNTSNQTINNPKPDPRFNYNGRSTSGNGDPNSTGQGNGGGIGNQGDPDGTPGGRGTGIGKEGLEGRHTVYKPAKPGTEVRGKVILRIKINRQGDVISAVPILEGSTTTDNEAWRLAKELTLKTKFNPNPNGPEFQSGKYTINFDI